MKQAPSIFIGVLATVIVLCHSISQGAIYQWEWSGSADNPQLYKHVSNTLCPDGADVSAEPNANLSHRDLNQAYLEFADLSDADLSFANFANAVFSSDTITNADFTGAIIKGAKFSSSNLTAKQFLSTASYQSKDLAGLWINNIDLTGVNFAGYDLSKTVISGATLKDADFSGAIVKGADFGGSNLAIQQLYTTASYHAKDLTGMSLAGANLTGINLAGCNLTNVNLQSANITNADLSGAILNGARFSLSNLTVQQIYSTASYQAKDLSNINFCGVTNLADTAFAGINFENTAFWGADLHRADFTNTNLSGAQFLFTDFRNAQLTGANFSGASLANVDFRGASGVYLDSAASLRNTILPDGKIVGLAAHYLLAGFRVNNGDIPLHVDGSPSFFQNVQISFNFDNNLWKSTISFDPNISLTLGGHLDLNFDSNVDVGSLVGHSYKLFDWNGNTPIGQFIIGGDEIWDTSNLYTTGEVTLLAVPEPETWTMMVAASFMLFICYFYFYKKRNRLFRHAPHSRSFPAL